MIYVVIATTKERRKRLERCIAAIRTSTIPHAIVIYENSDGGCVLATKKAIEGINGLIFLLNDDMVVAPDCLEKLYKAYISVIPNHDMVLQPWEAMHAGELGVSPFCHTDVIRPFLENYTHNFWDTEFTLVMKARGKYHKILNAKLAHEHFSVRLSPIDETYKLTQGKFLQDQETFRKRQAAGFPVANT